MTKLRHNPNGWLKLVAAEKRKVTDQELDHIALVTARTILKCIKVKAYNEKWLIDTLDGVYKSCIDAGCTERDFWKAQKETVHKVFGDPNEMYASNGHRQKRLPFWNPTKHKLNLSPMGLIDHIDPKTKEPTYIEFIGPGEHVWIPESYAKGGPYSTVKGVAPQLEQLPVYTDTELDLRPITYSEWCAYSEDSKPSNCCRKPVVWWDAGQAIICTKCGVKQ